MLLFAYFSSGSGHSISSCYLSCSLGSRYLLESKGMAHFPGISKGQFIPGKEAMTKDVCQIWMSQLVSGFLGF